MLTLTKSAASAVANANASRASQVGRGAALFAGGQRPKPKTPRHSSRTSGSRMSLAKGLGDGRDGSEDDARGDGQFHGKRRPGRPCRRRRRGPRWSSCARTRSGRRPDWPGRSRSRSAAAALVGLRVEMAVSQSLAQCALERSPAPSPAACPCDLLQGTAHEGRHAYEERGVLEIANGLTEEGAVGVGKHKIGHDRASREKGRTEAAAVGGSGGQLATTSATNLAIASCVSVKARCTRLAVPSAS